ncbi:MAG: cytochrome P450 [Solirubrobacterales bacterium]|nr:cytochrome P450 [Solirubrobacterales bacterium]
MSQASAAPESSRCPIRFEPLSPDQLRDPYPVYARMRAEEPVFYSEPHDLYVVTRYADAVAVLKDHETFSSQNSVRTSLAPPPPEVATELARGYPLSPTLTDSDEPVHRRLRGLVNKAFTHRRVAAMEDPIRRAAGQLIDDFHDDGHADLIEQFGWSLPLRAICQILGVPERDIERLHVWSYHWLKLLQATDPVTDQVSYARSVVDMQRYFLEALEARSANPGEDLMSALLEAAREGDEPLDMVEVMRVPMNLIIAGHVTVTRAIGNGVVLLLEHPEQRRLMLGDPEALHKGVEELLRLESPAQGLFRTVRTDAVVGDVTIPSGSRVMVHYAAANRDESQFERPNEFDLDRDGLLKHAAFGKGIHVCVGAPLARLELRVVIPLLFERLRGLRLAGEDATERDVIFFARGFTRVRVEWDVAGEQGGD